MRKKILIILLSLLLLPLILIEGFFIFSMKKLSQSVSQEYEKLGRLISGDVNQAMENLGKEIIKQKAIDVARQISIYMDSHPDMTIFDLQNDEKFRQIAVQKVGETGYTAITDYETLTCRLHVNPQIENLDLSALAEKLPGFWEIMSKTQGGIAADGFYDWQEADGSTRSKYMYIAIAEAKTADNVGLHVAATTYIDEFSKPAHAISGNIGLILKDQLSQMDNLTNKITLYFLLVFFILLAVSVTAGIIFADKLSKPIVKLATAAVKIGQGDFSAGLDTKRKDEIGQLAATFNQMAKDIKESREQIEKHSRDLEEEVARRTDELKKRNEELGRFNKLVVDREIKMVELKKRIKELEERNGSGKERA